MCNVSGNMTHSQVECQETWAKALERIRHHAENDE